jgi:hypothetical protein
MDRWAGEPQKIGCIGLAIRAAKFKTSDGGNIAVFVPHRKSLATAISSINSFRGGSDGLYFN